MTSTPEQVIAKIREPYSEPPLTCPHIDRLVERGYLPQKVLDELFSIRDINSQLRYGTWVLKARAEAAEAERDALRKALEPFAAVAARMDDSTIEFLKAQGFGSDMLETYSPSSDRILTSGEVRGSTAVTLGDLRRARTLLAGDNHE